MPIKPCTYQLVCKEGADCSMCECYRPENDEAGTKAYRLLTSAWTHILAVHNMPGIVRGWQTIELLDKINAYLNANRKEVS